MINLELNEKKYPLVASYQACRDISREFGGLRPALERVAQMDMTAAAFIIQVGSSAKLSEVESDLFANGLLTVGEQLARYLDLLANGGRASKKESA